VAGVTCIRRIRKRQALVTHAVTKGLDPNVGMKDSGVEWLPMLAYRSLLSGRLQLTNNVKH
jgi:hypothetical protein